MSSPLARLSATADAVASRQLVFVGGQGKSGTTWVQLLLDAHPDVSAHGEALLAEVLGPVAFQLAAHYNERLAANNAHFPELEDFPRLDAVDADTLAAAALLPQLGKLVERKPNARVLAERTPSNIEHLGALAALFPHGRFVHVIRDPRDVAISLWWHARRIGDSKLLAGYGSPTALAAALLPRWARLIRAARDAARQTGAALHELRYEDLLATPHEAASELFRFVGADAEPALVQAALAAADFETLTGRSRGDEVRGSHFRAGTAGQWREAMAGALPGITAEDEALLKSLGYPDNA